MAIAAPACGTTVIAPQPGHQWCVEVQNPEGHESNPDPEAFDASIFEPGGGDPTGCLCLTTEEDAILDQGVEAEKVGDPPPAGYEALRDELRLAARQRCSELAQTEFNPPLMYTNCLSADVSLPLPTSTESDCTICIKAGVWNDSKVEVECPEEGQGTDGATTMSHSTESESADTTEGAGFDCQDWDPAASISSAYYSTGRPAGYYHNVHTGLLDTLVGEQFVPALLCDSARYVEQPSGVWAFEDVAVGDFVWTLGIRSGYERVQLRGYDLAKEKGTTSWFGFESLADSIEAFEALQLHTTFEVMANHQTSSGNVERHTYVNVMDCSTPHGASCPPP